MALRGEVDDGINAFAEGGFDGRAIGDIASDEAVAGVLGDVREVLEIARVREAVEVDDRYGRIGFEEIADEVTADEPAATGHEKGRHRRFAP
jgi:hypothetical protein